MRHLLQLDEIRSANRKRMLMNFITQMGYGFAFGVGLISSSWVMGVLFHIKFC